MVAHSLTALERHCIVRGLRADEGRVRVDMRAPHESRPFSVSFDAARRGCATVVIGGLSASERDMLSGPAEHTAGEAPASGASQRVHGVPHTRVMATVSATLVRPGAERPAEGSVSYYVEMDGGAEPLDDWALAAAGADGGGGAVTGAQSSSAASSTAATLAGDDECASVQHALERVLKSGAARFVDTSALCVVPGQMAWALRVDVCVQCSDGALADAAVAASVAALCDFRRPDHAVDAATGAVRVYSAHERHPVPLALGPVVLAASVLCVDVRAAAEPDATTRHTGGDHALLVDPCAREAALARASGGRGVACVVVALGASPSAPGSIVHVHKAGGEPLAARVLAEHVVPLALARVRAVAAVIDAELSKRPAY